MCGTSRRAISPCSRLTKTSASKSIGASIRWRCCAPGMQFVSAGHIVSGGSTLTMQVARILEPPRSRGIGTKLFQMMRALQLEERYSKDEITLLLSYARAVRRQSRRRARRVAVLFRQAAVCRSISPKPRLLVALPQSPVKQRPDRHAIRAARKGRDKVLARMVSEGIVSPGRRGRLRGVKACPSRARRCRCWRRIWRCASSSASTTPVSSRRLTRRSAGRDRTPGGAGGSPISATARRFPSSWSRTALTTGASLIWAA